MNYLLLEEINLWWKHNKNRFPVLLVLANSTDLMNKKLQWVQFKHSTKEVHLQRKKEHV